MGFFRDVVGGATDVVGGATSAIGNVVQAIPGSRAGIESTISNPLVNPMGTLNQRLTGVSPVDQAKIAAAAGLVAGAAGAPMFGAGGTAAGAAGAGLTPLPASGMVGTGSVSAADAALMGVGGAGATGAGTALGAGAAGLGAGAATGGLLSGNTLGALALGGASLYGSKLTSDALERAGEIQAQAGQQALTEQARQFDIGRAGQQPYMDYGLEAAAEERALLGLGGEDPRQRLRALMQAPGVQFARQQGQRSLETSAAARGGLFSGATGKALNRYGQQFATGQYGNRLSQLANVAQRGQSAASGQANLGANYASNVGDLYTGIGSTRARSEIAQEQARQSGITGVATAAERLFNPPQRQLTLSDYMR